VKILDKEFLGPISLEFNKLPDVSAIYVIVLKDQDDFQPLYIGIASRLSHRIRTHVFNGFISDNIESENDLSIFYWEFNSETREEAEDLELRLIKKYNPNFNKNPYGDGNKSKLNIKIEQLKKEEEHRSKQWFRSSIIASMSLIIGISAVFTFYMEGKKEAELKSILEKELSISSADFLKSKGLAETQLNRLISDLNEQQEALKTLDLSDSESFAKEVPKEIVKLNARVASIEAGITKLTNSRILEKMNVIETSINGSPEKVLSVPLLRNDLSNYKLISDKELLRLEKSIEKIDSRLSFFVTTTITLILGIFTAVIAPLIITFVQRRNEKNTSGNNT